MPSPAGPGRRHFVASLAALSAAPLVEADPTPSGLARSEDYLFAPGLVYLQTASLGPTPRPVMDRTIAAWKELEQNPVHYGYRVHEDLMEAVRARAAAFLGCRLEEMALTRSTTEGMNSVALGIDFSAGDRVLTTDQEHPGGRWCWEWVARKRGVAIDTVVIPPGENDAAAIVERFRKALTPRTRVLSFSHVLSSTGLRMPVAELAALAGANGSLSVVDGAQAAGGIAVDVSALGCDVYVTSGHKWLLGPKGTGLLYIAARVGNRVDIVGLQNGRAVYTDAVGVTNIPGVIGLGAALEYIEALGIRAVEAHDLRLRNDLFERLKEIPRVLRVSPPPGPLASPLVTVKLGPETESRAFMMRLLEKHRLVVKMVPKNWLNGIRFSTHLFNTPAHVDAAISALRAEL